MRRPVLILCLMVLLGVVLSTVFRAKQARARRTATEARVSVSPTKSSEGGYVSSDACKACHPGEYASWHRTYHRTMTQVATPETVLGDFDDVKLEYFGKQFHLERRGDEFWVSQEGGSSAKVVQTTGSHHYQVYWISMGKGQGNLLQNFPFVYLLKDQRWARRNDVFMMPPAIGNQPESVLPWNDHCIACHSTHGQARVQHEQRRSDTQVAELGIACEACHGPAEEHIKHYSNPANRYTQHFADTDPVAITNPATCSSKQSAQICGQCHGVTRELDRSAWNERGFDYRPKDELEDTRIVARHPKKVSQSWHRSASRTFFDQYFWRDGMIRVSGREYNGLLETPCYQRGELSCLSCHSLHDSDPNDQIAHGMEGNAACLQCHEDIGEDITAHTHHSEDSSGSLCYNCHMPHTTYGLIKVIRSHQIDSPNVMTTVQSGRPQACNLCHLDKSLGWTAEHLTDWYDQPVPLLTEQQKTVSSTVLHLLSGDAGQRAIAAWHMGWAPAQETSGHEWLAPYLAEVFDDPYSVVRYIAYHALKSLPEFSDFEYDYTEDDETLTKKSDELAAYWRSLAPPTPNSELLIDENGALMTDRVDLLKSQRDDRPVDLLE